VPDQPLLAHFPDLLERLGSSFDVDFVVSGRTLAGHLERFVTAAVAGGAPPWGVPGDRFRLDDVHDSALTFLYRPHLFPEMEATLRLGHLVQFHSLPRELPDGAPVAVAALLESYCHLSGDLFGWRETGDGGLLLWLADASGHGVRAGFAAVVLRLLLDELPPNLPLPTLVGELERRFVAARNPCDRRPLYATGVFLRFTPEGGASYLSAGHPPILLREAAGGVREYGPTCPPIGLLPPSTGTERPLALERDDLLLLCTDGLVEAGDAAGSPFGGERLRGELAAASGGPATVAAAVYAAVARHHDLTRLDDDLTFLVVARSDADANRKPEDRR